MQVSIEDLIVEGNKVAVRTTWQGSHTGEYESIPPTGKQVMRSMIQIFTIENGQIQEEWNEGASLQEQILK
jgi:predicted ester cyclase